MLMPKIYDLLPPQRRTGDQSASWPAAQSEQEDYSALTVQPHDLHQPAASANQPVTTVVEEVAVPRRLFGTLWQPVAAATKQGLLYFGVGLASFLVFSLLFYGFNRYQDRQRAALQGEQVAGDQVTVTPAGPSIRILNGSGSAERLAELETALEATGYEARSVGTAAQPAEETVIYFRAVAQQAALQLADRLSAFTPRLEQNDDLVGTDDIVVLLGRD